jgi:hypothetical protein
MHSKKRVSASIAAQNTFTDPVKIEGSAVVELSGTWSATVSVQRRTDETNWRDVTDNNGTAVTFSGNGQYTFTEPCRDAEYRVGIKTGNYTSGTLVAEIQQ